MKIMRKGQTMVEYILIISLIALALIGAFTLLGNKLKDKTTEAAEAVENSGGGN